MITSSKRKAAIMSEKREFQKIAKRISHLTPNSTPEEIAAVFAGADNLSEFDTARFLCLLYGYSGIFAKHPPSFLDLLTKAFDFPTTKRIHR